MHRFLSPKPLALAAFGLVMIAAMVWLGLWQFGVYDTHQRAQAEAALLRPSVPLSTVMGPDSPVPSAGVSRPVTVTGRYLTGQQVFVTNLPGATRRYAVVTPLVTSNGSAVMVVRGSQDSLTAPAPRGTVTVRGVLEASVAAGTSPNSRRIADGLEISSLVNAVRPDLYAGYVLQQSSSPAQHPSMTPVVAPLPDPSRWSGVRNLLYACQWWVFALFVVFMWWWMTGDMEAQYRAKRVAADSNADAVATLR